MHKLYNKIAQQDPDDDGSHTRISPYGKLHRSGDKPAIIRADGSKEWRVNGKLHRDGDKPAVIYADGTKKWCVNGKLHRDGDKPAVIYADGSKEWRVNGKLHRDGDEPAILWANGYKEWWVNGIYCKDNFNIEVNDDVVKRYMSNKERSMIHKFILASQEYFIYILCLFLFFLPIEAYYFPESAIGARILFIYGSIVFFSATISLIRHIYLQTRTFVDDMIVMFENAIKKPIDV